MSIVKKVSLLTLKNINANVPSVQIKTELMYLTASLSGQKTIYPSAEPTVAKSKFVLLDTAISETAKGAHPPTTLERQRKNATKPQSVRLAHFDIFFISFLGIFILSFTVIFTLPTVHYKLKRLKIL